MNFSLLIYIGLGGFLGAISRFLISNFTQRQVNILFPIGTLSVNVLGSFIIGFMAMFFQNMIEPQYKAFVMTGFLGALTTFSTFSLENVNMLQDGDYGRVALNITLNVTLSVVATMAAIVLFKKLYT